MPSLVKWYQRMQDKGQPNPLDKLPPLKDHLAPVLIAFDELSPYRNEHGMVPISEINGWLLINRIDDYETQRLYFNYIRALNLAWVQEQAQDANTTSSNRRKKSSGGR